MNRRSLALVLAAVAVAVPACAGRAPPPVPAAAFPGLDPGRLVVLRAEDVAEDAIRRGDLLAVLDRAGFATGSERTFVGREGVRSVTARVLRFEASGGAGEYVRWIAEHASDVLGASRSEPPLPVGGGTARVFSAAPGGCCPKAMTTVLAAWQRDDTVLTVLATGPDARDALGELVRTFDDAATDGEEDR